MTRLDLQREARARRCRRRLSAAYSGWSTNTSCVWKPAQRNCAEREANDLALHPIYIADLCAGTGQGALGVRLALGWERVHTVLYVERDSYAAATLVARMADQTLDPAPVWDDVTTCTSPACLAALAGARPLIVTAGYPCQPFSCAGKRLGEQDERHLWPHIDEFIEACKPECCFFENVPGHLSMGYARVRGDLERRGYRVAAGLFSAAEVGASHRRERLFILGVADPGSGFVSDPGRGPSGRAGADAPGASLDDATGPRLTAGQCAADDERLCGGRMCEPGRRCTGLAHATRERCQGQCVPVRPGRCDGASPHADGIITAMADADCVRGADRPEVARGAHAAPSQAGCEFQSLNRGATVADAGGPGLSRSERAGASDEWVRRDTPGPAPEFRPPLFAPSPADPIWSDLLAARPDLAPAVEPRVCRTADGVAYRLDADRLRCAGNGVVPLVAAYAFVSLWAALQYQDDA